MRLRQILPLACLLALALPAAGCADPLGPLIEQSLDVLPVTPTADGLVVVNRSSRDIYVLAIERGTTALVDWIPCVTLPSCVPQTAGTTRLLPWSRVLGFAPDRREYVVYWWGAVTGPDGTMIPDKVNNVVVTR